jgi:hypothetical protein
MTKDHTQLAIENGAKGLNRGIVYFEEIAEFNATIEAAIKQAFDEAEVIGYLWKEPSKGGGGFETLISKNSPPHIQSCVLTELIARG